MLCCCLPPGVGYESCFQIVSGALKILQNSFQIFKLSIKVILSFSLNLTRAVSLILPFRAISKVLQSEDQSSQYKTLVRLRCGYFGSYFWTT
jgi:hypothetical protein